jgi:hypothetical protein
MHLPRQSQTAVYDKWSEIPADTGTAPKWKESSWLILIATTSPYTPGKANGG